MLFLGVDLSTNHVYSIRIRVKLLRVANFSIHTRRPSYHVSLRCSKITNYCNDIVLYKIRSSISDTVNTCDRFASAYGSALELYRYPKYKVFE